MMDWKIGCSGFAYKDWQGLFYPYDLVQADWLPYYARFFDTVELNVSFYKFPTARFLKNLYNKVPEDFSFILKAPREITHTRQFVEVNQQLEQLYAAAGEGLSDKLKGILFQLPPSYDYTEERLDMILDNMDTGFTNILEFRHRSWWNKRVIASLKQRSVTFCGVSFPGLPDDVVVSNAVAYYRFHGVPKLYYSMYEQGFLRNVADTLQKDPVVGQALLLFNNTATRAALENASFLQEYAAF
ncbi:DUF72 domain-containing protein [Ferruginibacter sp. HRS2-29]|nr:DUF72 domain-containing protein [Ferruginibacter sp. HRS2-29]